MGVKTVLIIDDDEALLRSYTRILKGYYALSLCSDPQEALELLLNGTEFDLILCDFHMPGMSGEQLYSHLQEEIPDMAAKMLFMSGGGEKWLDFVEQSSRPTIFKPFRGEELRKFLTVSGAQLPSP